MDEKIKIEIMKECVRRCENEHPNLIYIECLEKMKKITLRNITEEEVKNVIKPFLYKWGGMGRVLGRSKFQNWESDFVKLIQSHSEKLEEFRKKDLTEVDLNKLEYGIKKCYESFKNVVGKVAAVKVLHLICSDFFPIWDSGIAKAVSKIKGFPEEDYYRFMQEMQNFVKNYEEVFSDLANQYRRSKLRILDEFLWWLRREQLSLFF